MKTGTHEWSQATYNIQQGCSNSCIYCYGEYDACTRYHRVRSHEEWVMPVLKQPMAKLPSGKKLVMFPSTHDITPANLPICICAIRLLLDKGHRVLVVSKADTECMSAICKTFQEERDRMELRVTIGTLHRGTAAFWEPGAPTLTNRWGAVRVGLAHGYRVSVSSEPILDGSVEAVEALVDYALRGVGVAEIWLGLMNQAVTRVAGNCRDSRPAGSGLSPVNTAFDLAKFWHRDDFVNLRELHRRVDRAGVMWKDSIRKALKLEGI